jgi:hypothetical protein
MDVRQRASVVVFGSLLVAACSTGQTGGNGATTAAPTGAATRMASQGAAPSGSAGLCGPIPAQGSAALPFGEYSTEPIPLTKLVTELEAKGLKDVKQMLESHGYTVTESNTQAVIFCFVDGEWGQYWQQNGGIPDIGSTGTYTISGKTLELREAGLGSNKTTFSVSGEQLTLGALEPSQPDPDPFGPYAAAMLTANPFVRQP